MVTSLAIVIEPQDMWNLTIDEAHTFFVGDGEWLVHNTCGVREFNNPQQRGRHFFASERDDAWEFAQERLGVSGDPIHQFDFYGDRPPTPRFMPNQSIQTNIKGRQGHIYVYEVDNEYHFIVEHFFDDAGVNLPHFHTAILNPQSNLNGSSIPDLYQYFRRGGRYTEFPNQAHIHYGTRPAWAKE